MQGGERGLRRDGLHQETVRSLQIPEVSQVRWPLGQLC